MTDTKNREEVIQHNLVLVHAFAVRFRSRGIEYDDLYAAGCVGLIKAYDGFDWGRGVCFSTYAVPVILGEIKKLFRDGGTVKVSRSVKELGIKASAVREKLLKEMGSEPTVSQIAQRLNASAEQVAMALKAGLPAISLTPAGENDGNRELDIPIDSPEEELTDRISLQEVMQRLSPEEQKLIRLRYFCGRTQSETARMLNTTQVQISRRERKLLGLMRRQLIGG